MVSDPLFLHAGFQVYYYTCCRTRLPDGFPQVVSPFFHAAANWTQTTCQAAISTSVGDICDGLQLVFPACSNSSISSLSRLPAVQIGVTLKICQEMFQGACTAMGGTSSPNFCKSGGGYCGRTGVWANMFKDSSQPCKLDTDCQVCFGVCQNPHLLV